MTSCKCLYIGILFFIGSDIFGQSSLKKIIQETPQMVLPYTSLNRDMAYFKKRRILKGVDSINFINKLRELTLTQVNRYNGGFSNADCFLRLENQEVDDLTQNCLENINEISIVARLKLTNVTVLNVELYDNGVTKYSLLLTVDKDGNLVNGLVGAYSTGWYNKHGTVSREFTIIKTNLIQISEGSIGDNTIKYGLTALYRTLKEGDLELKRISITFK